jgi:TRAP-type C4-dicarboxylate transport system permease small subunit
MLSLFVHNAKILGVMKVVKNVICLGVATVATYWSFNYVMWSISMHAVSNVFKLPIVIAQLPIFISFFLWTLYLIRDVIRSIKELKAVNNTEKEGE